MIKLKREYDKKIIYARDKNSEKINLKIDIINTVKWERDRER